MTFSNSQTGIAHCVSGRDNKLYTETVSIFIYYSSENNGWASYGQRLTFHFTTVMSSARQFIDFSSFPDRLISCNWDGCGLLSSAERVYNDRRATFQQLLGPRSVSASLAWGIVWWICTCMFSVHLQYFWTHILCFWSTDFSETCQMWFAPWPTHIAFTFAANSLQFQTLERSGFL